MIRAAVEATDSGVLVLGVTVLTSSNEQTLSETGIRVERVEEQVLRLANLGLDNGLRGFVASPLEAALLKKTAGEGVAIVTPGVRLSDATLGDQKRVLTPRQALASGATHLVIGRPITAAPDPMVALKAVLADLEG